MGIFTWVNIYFLREKNNQKNTVYVTIQLRVKSGLGIIHTIVLYVIQKLISLWAETEKLKHMDRIEILFITYTSVSLELHIIIVIF